MSVSFSPYETGLSTTKLMVGDYLEKTSAYLTDEQTATTLADNLQAYSQSLSSEPLPAAPITSIAVVKLYGGYAVRHTMPVVPGVNLCETTSEQRFQATQQLLEQIAAMRSLHNTGKLVTPIDARATNFQVDPQRGATLVDLFPPMARELDGSFAIQTIPYGDTLGRKHILPYVHGYRSAVMSRILATLISSGGTSPTRVFSLMTNSPPDWCYDVIPPTISPAVKDSIRRSLRLHFADVLVPTIASGALRSVRSKIGLPAYATTKNHG
ncbi:MAG TPA: hypothetical protein VLG92_03495 [Candidatus Saccharimonadia bacterium]|nr:hypothetical protein [Candidatus Saccharimonadia bacterium]